jgi:hypothetical protein
MAAKSNNKYDVYEWVMQIINSCETYFHYRAADNIIDNFFNIYQDSDLSESLRWNLSKRELRQY